MIDWLEGEATAYTPQWAKVIDQTRCIGCHACTTACKSENEVPLGVSRTYVKYVDVGTFPQARRAFQVTRCNQCVDAPCTTACPTTAMYTRPDGIVDFNKDSCIGCRACMAACPYDAIFINPRDHFAEKCNFCAHRLDVGLEPACVIVCPTEAILVGDLRDPTSKVAQVVNRDVVSVRRPEKATRPKLFYKGAHQATLDPIAARRPEGGIFMWSEQTNGSHHAISGNSHDANSSATAVLSYDVSHEIPWDWRVSLYTWTKSIAAGAYMVLAFLLVFGLMSPEALLWRVVTPVLAGVFLAATGGLLIWDLEHPERFLYIFTRAQWKSWLVRGAFLITGYSLVLLVHFLAGLSNLASLTEILIVPGLPLAILTAAYTAFLFAQARARDLWQNPLLPPHIGLIQAALAGSAAVLPFAAWLDSGLVADLLWILAGSALLHLLLLVGEATLGHPTSHAHLAAQEMLRGRYARFFWVGAVLMLGAVAAPLIGLVAVPLALVGLLAYEHAYVQSGQSVPLA
jgi:Fe-S-cluster-containing dehydrogenase component